MMARRAGSGGLLLASALSLAACEEQRIASKDVLESAATLENPAPGLYEVTTRLEDFDVTGVSPQVADRLRSQMGQVKEATSRFCITPEEADRGFEPLLEQFAEGQQSLDCGFTRFETDAPRFNARLSCTGPLDARAQVSFAGETSRAGFDMAMESEAGSRLIAGGTMEMRMRFVSRRIGDCEDDQADTAP